MKRLLAALVLFYIDFASCNSNVFGDKSAPVEVIEYSSFTCPHCADFHNDDFSKIEEKYIKTGKVKFTHKSLFHPQDIVSAKISMLPYCSGIDYRTVLKVLMRTQKNWMFETNKHLEVVTDILRFGGATNEDIATCLNNKEVEDMVLNIQLDAMNNLKITGTPTFFVNGKKYDGHISAKHFSKIIDEILNGKAQ